MFFCKANRKNAESLKALLSTYEAVSGQLINKDKSSVFFSRKTSTETRDMMKNVLGIEKEGGMGKYLGLPEHFGRKKKDVFASVVGRIQQRASSWSSKFLSNAGKMIMVKSVLSPMSSHTMSCFKIPQSVCSNIQSTLTRFWWDTEPGKRKVSWISWDQMARPKKNGGLGFKDVTMFNDALLGKLGWRILKNPSGLLARCLLGKYCQKDSFLKCEAPQNASHGWKSVLIGRDLLKKQLGWMVGTGESINVWEDAWLSHSEQMRPFGPVPEGMQSLKVSDLIHQETSEWNIEQIERCLPFHKEQILKIKPSTLRIEDTLVWMKNPTGEYTTRSGYLTVSQEKTANLPQNPASAVDWFPSVWNIKTSEKIKVFLWKSLLGALPVGEQFAVRNIPVSALCTRCKAVESVHHLLFQCPFADKVWKLAPFPIDINSAALGNFKEGWERVRKLPSLPPVGIEPGSLAAWICWSLWRSRNHLIFEKRSFSPEETIQKAISDAREWQRAQSPPPLILSSPLIRCEPNPSKPGGCTIFTDAAWNSSSGFAGLGWIIDDLESSSQHTATETSVSSPLMAETLAVRSALTFALSRNIQSVSIFSDSQKLMQTINKKMMNLEIFGALNDIYQLSSLFNSIAFKFIPRSANVWADQLAKQALWAVNTV